MIGLLSIVALGFFLGMRHATDPDHVIAVTTIVARHRSIRHAAMIGAFWGVGHTLTIVAVGAGIILLGWVIPARVGLSMEFSVGVMLVLLGVANLTGILTWINQRFSRGAANDQASEAHVIEARLDDHALSHMAHLHSHAHSHGDYIHSHAHGHDPELHTHRPDQTPLAWLDRHFGRIGAYQLARPLVVGLVHGLAGSAAVALLVLTTIKSPRWALAYLLVFGVGTIAGMMLMTAALSLPFTYTSSRFLNLNRGLRIATGVISVAFGLFITYEIGVVNGLFSHHPSWTPR